MYKIPTANETVAHIIARGTLGVYAAKFDIVGTEQERNWRYRRYDVTLYRLDMWKNGAFIIKIPYKQGINIKRDPTTRDVVEALQGDMDTYDSISDYGNCHEYDILQNYVNDFGYDSKDPEWLKNTIKTVMQLQGMYDDLMNIFENYFTARLSETADAIFVKTHEEYEPEALLDLICLDPDEDEMNEIEKGDYDIDDIKKRYSSALQGA